MQRLPANNREPDAVRSCDDECRVLLAVTGLGVGGAERVVLDLARHLDRHAVSCEVASFTSDLQSLEVYGPPGVPCNTFDLKSDVRARLVALQEYVRLIDSYDPHVIHAHMYHALMFTIMAVRFSRRKPRIVFTSHSNYISSFRGRVIRATRHLRDADILLSAEQHPTINTPRTVVIPNGVAVSESPPSRTCKADAVGLRFVSVGRLAPEKDPLGLIQAFAAANLKGAQLDMIGQGPLEPQVRSLVRSLSLGNQVQLLGLCHNVRDHLRAADVFLMHSVHEGLPMAILEAGAEALPIISTKVGAVPQLLADARGYIADGPVFADTIRLVAQHLSDAMVRGRRLHRHVSTYHSTRAMVTAHQEFYRRLTAESRRNRSVSI